MGIRIAWALEEQESSQQEQRREPRGWEEDGGLWTVGERGKKESMKAVVASVQVGNRDDLGVGSDGDKDDSNPWKV